MEKESVLSEQENDSRWLLLQAKINEQRLRSAICYFRENGVEPLLIKGWAAARQYPEPFRRHFTDIDLCVAPEAFERAEWLLANERVKSLNIDLHKGLRHLDTVGWNELWSRSVLVPLDGIEVRVLKPEDHLRVLCVHWLTDGGANRERLRDLKYLLEAQAERFDWNDCLGPVSRRRRGWIIRTVALAKRFYGLEIDESVVPGDLDYIPLWLEKALAKEWRSEVRLIPLHRLLGDRRKLWAQLKKRFPPNAVQATIDVEGDIDRGPRFVYQIGSVLVRLKPSFLRLIKTTVRSIRSNKSYG